MNLFRFYTMPLRGSEQSQVRRTNPLGDDALTCLLLVRLLCVALLLQPQQVLAVTLILFFIVIALLYSVTFVTQPIKSMAPIDQAYTKILNDIVLLIVGGIGGVIGKRAMTSRQQPPPMGQQPMCQPMQGGYGQYGYSNNHGFNATTNA